MKKPIIYLFTSILLLALSSCKKEDDSKPDMPDINIIDISGESNWDYWVIGTKDYYFIKTNGSVPEAVLFHSSDANKDYSIFFTNDGYLDKVVVDDYIVSFKNPNGNKIDIGIIYPNGKIEILRDLETYYDWDNNKLKSASSIEAWSDVVRWTGRVVSGVPCGLSVAAAIMTSGVGTPLAFWVCGNYLLGLTADILENEFEIHNGYTHFANAWSTHTTIASCSGGDGFLVCADDLISKAFSAWADHLEEIEYRNSAVQFLDAALSRDLLNGLISYWKFDGNLNDSHSENNGNAAVGVTSLNAVGIINQCPYFNGASNAYITFGNDPSLNITGTAMTMAAWVYNEKTSGRGDIISKGRDYTSNYGYHLLWYNSNNTVNALYRLSNGQNNSVSTPTLNNNTWYHIVSTFDGTYGKLYVNGELVSTTEQSGSIGNANTQFVIGAHSAGPTGWGYQWKGKIDEVGIWNRVLSDVEVLSLYNNGIGIQYPF